MQYIEKVLRQDLKVQKRLTGDVDKRPKCRTTEAIVIHFCEIYNLKHLIEERTCF